jgi:hypothetical protein
MRSNGAASSALPAVSDREKRRLHELRLARAVIDGEDWARLAELNNTALPKEPEPTPAAEAASDEPRDGAVPKFTEDQTAAEPSPASPPPRLPEHIGRRLPVA